MLSWKNISFKWKLLVIGGAGIIPLVLTLAFSIVTARESLQAASRSNLEGLLASKGGEVQRYFSGIRDQATTFAENLMVVEGMQAFADAFKVFRSENEISEGDITRMRSVVEAYYRDQFNPVFRKGNDGKDSDWRSYVRGLDANAIAFQYHFIAANPHPLGEKDALETPGDKSAYSALHAAIHPVVRSFLDKFGYYDIFLVEPENGIIIYSVFKELDYATSMIDGPYASTGIGACFQAANRITTPGEFAFMDFAPYPPSYMAEASFIGTPVFAGDKKIGVVMFQMPVDRITEVMSSRDGLGETGELFLAGGDGRQGVALRSVRVDRGGNEIAAIGSRLDTAVVGRAVAGQASYGQENWAGVNMMVAAAPLDILGKAWAVSGMQAVSEVMAPAQRLLSVGILVALVAVLVLISVTYVVSLGISRPLAQGIALLTRLAREGDLQQKVDERHLSRGDEVGQILAAVSGMLDANQKELAITEAIASGDWSVDVPIRSDKDELGQALRRMCTKVGETLSQVRESINQVSSGSEQIADASQSLSQGATESAASLEEISASATQIGQQAKMNAETATQANQLANTAKAAAESGSQRMEALNTAMGAITESSSQIAKIIKTIDDIAFQTNILALNAAVEAARAGRHGKGFAVVAGEVRTLAARSAKAARETSELIEGSAGRVEQGNKIARETADALAEIVGGIVKVGDLVGEMAAASNEQAQGISEITQGLGQIDQVTQQNTATAEETAAAAEELSGQASELRSLIGQFRLKTTDSRQQTTDYRQQGAEGRERGAAQQSRASGVGRPALPPGGGWGSMPQAGARKALGDSGTSGESGKIQWTEAFSVGNRKIDEQHKRLVKLVNDMYEAMRQGKANAAITPILDELVQYTVRHFADEESMLKLYKYPGLVDHQKLHAELIRQVTELKGEFDRGLPVGTKVFNFLKGWLINHIQQQDKQYSEYLPD
jgi:methyl-accepting chemotaxis protein